MSLTPYPTLRLKLTPQPALKMRFLPAVPGSHSAADAAAAEAAAEAAAASAAFASHTEIGVVIDGGGAVIAPGVKLDMPIGMNLTITGWTLVADVSGSIVLNIWKDTYTNFPPTVADKITASAPPTISAALKAQDFTLPGWTKTLAPGDILRFNVDSITSIKRATLTLFADKALS